MTAKTNKTNQEEQNETAAIVSHVADDLKNSILIVSTVGYLALFTIWMLLQITTQYDASLASLIFNR